MDLLDFDGGNNSLNHSSTTTPVLQTVNSSVSYSLDELLSFDSATTEPKPDILHTMKDLQIEASASYASEKFGPEFSGNPFDLLGVSTSSSAVKVPESDAKILMTGPMPTFQPQAVSSFKLGGVNPTNPFFPPQQMHHLASMTNQSSAPLGSSPFTTQQRTSNFDPYVACERDLTPANSYTLPTFQQQQQQQQHHLEKSNDILQPLYSTPQAAVSLMVAQQQQQFVHVRGSTDGGHRHVQPHLASTAVMQGQHHHQLHGNAGSSLQQASAQQQSSMSIPFSLPHYGVGNVQMPSIPDNSNPQRQLQGLNTRQKNQQNKANIQFDPFA